MRATLAALVATAVMSCAATPPPLARASDGWALNGTFTATSNGEWARTNDVFHDERSVRAVWTITSQCSYPTECTGTVSSDQGWTAPIYQTSGEWYVKHVVENWMPCPDGSSAPGYQVFRFKRMTPDGGYRPDLQRLGWRGCHHRTQRCLRSQPVVVHCHAVQAGQTDLTTTQPVGNRSVQDRSPTGATTSVCRATPPSGVANCPVLGS